MIYFLLEVSILLNTKIINLYINNLDQALSDLLDLTFTDGSYILRIIPDNSCLQKNGIMCKMYPYYYIKRNKKFYKFYKLYRSDNQCTDSEECFKFKDKMYFLKRLCRCNKDKLYIIYQQIYNRFCNE